MSLLDSAPSSGSPRAPGPVPSGPWLTPSEAAAYLRVALGTLRNWTSLRYVPHAKKGRVVRYHRGQLDRWLAGGARRGRMTLANQRPDVQAPGSGAAPDGETP